MTGAIRPYGDISPVGGIYAKITAAAQDNYKVLLAPDKNSVELALLDFDQLGSMQIICGRTFEDYLSFAIPSLSASPDYGRKTEESYAVAYLLYKLGFYGESKSVLRQLLRDCPMHVSGQMLLKKYDLAHIEERELPQELLTMLLAQPPGAAPSSSK